MTAFKKISYTKVDTPKVPREGVSVQHPYNYILYFKPDSEGGLLVTEEVYMGGSGGYPYGTLRRDEPATSEDMKELIKHQADRRRMK